MQSASSGQQRASGAPYLGARLPVDGEAPPPAQGGRPELSEGRLRAGRLLILLDRRYLRRRCSGNLQILYADAGKFTPR